MYVFLCRCTLDLTLRSLVFRWHRLFFSTFIVILLYRLPLVRTFWRGSQTLVPRQMKVQPEQTKPRPATSRSGGGASNNPLSTAIRQGQITSCLSDFKNELKECELEHLWDEQTKAGILIALNESEIIGTILADNLPAIAFALHVAHRQQKLVMDVLKLKIDVQATLKKLGRSTAEIFHPYPKILTRLQTFMQMVEINAKLTIKQLPFLRCIAPQLRLWCFQLRPYYLKNRSEKDFMEAIFCNVDITASRYTTNDEKRENSSRTNAKQDWLRFIIQAFMRCGCFKDTEKEFKTLKAELVSLKREFADKNRDCFKAFWKEACEYEHFANKFIAHASNFLKVDYYFDKPVTEDLEFQANLFAAVCKFMNLRIDECRLKDKLEVLLQECRLRSSTLACEIPSWFSAEDPARAGTQQQLAQLEYERKMSLFYAADLVDEDLKPKSGQEAFNQYLAGLLSAKKAKFREGKVLLGFVFVASMIFDKAEKDDGIEVVLQADNKVYLIALAIEFYVGFVTIRDRISRLKHLCSSIQSIIFEATAEGEGGGEREVEETEALRSFRRQQLINYCLRGKEEPETDDISMGINELYDQRKLPIPTVKDDAVCASSLIAALRSLGNVVQDNRKITAIEASFEFEYRLLATQISDLKLQNTSLDEKNKKLVGVNKEMAAENEEWMNQYEILIEGDEKSTSLNVKVKRENTELVEKNNQLIKEKAELEKNNAELTERIIKLTCKDAEKAKLFELYREKNPL